MSIYSMRNVPGGYTILKMDDDYNPDGIYNIRWEENEKLLCSCPAGVRDTCRHRQMAWLFKAEGKLDTGWMYHFEKKIWIKPIVIYDKEPINLDPITEEEKPTLKEVDDEVQAAEREFRPTKPTWRRF